jgi:glycosyltransferase involved in cell wall biosynthesis
MSARSFCMVTTFYPPHHFGGDAMYVYRLSNALARRGHDVTVVHCADAHAVLGGRAGDRAYPNHPNVELKTIRTPVGPISPVVTYLTGRPGVKAPILRNVFRRHYDVVHFHNVSLVGGPAVLEYGDGVKLYTMHEHWLVCPTHVLWKYKQRLCEAPACFTCQLTYRRIPQPWRYTDLLERSLEHVDVFLSPSRFTARIHRERGFPFAVRHLPLFLPDDDLRADPGGSSPGRGDGRPYVLYVGRLERLKGVHTLIELFRSYDAVNLVIAGDGPEAGGLHAQAADLDHVRFLGNVDAAELRPLYAGALALVVPSLVHEVFPLVCIEALAEGCPVVARDVGGLRESIDDSGAGFVYRHEAEVLEAVEQLREQPELRAELGRLGQETFARLWSEDEHLRGYFAAIDSVVERS